MTQLKHESKISQIEALRPLDWIKCRQVKVQHECKFTPKKRQLSKKFLWVVKIVLPVRARPRQSCEMHRATPTLSLSTTPGRYFRGTKQRRLDKSPCLRHFRYDALQQYQRPNLFEKDYKNASEMQTKTYLCGKL